MRYCLINNTYHYRDLIKYFSADFIESLNFIIVPVNLDISELPSSQISLELPSFSLRSFKKELLRNGKIKREISKSFTSISAKDTLYVFTEIELRNQQIIEFFKSKNVEIILIEDGTATPILFNADLNKPNFKAYAVGLFLKILFGFKNTRLLQLGSSFAYYLPDSYFSSLLQFSSYPITRDIKTSKVDYERILLFTRENNNVVYFGQHLYRFYCTLDEYLKQTEILLSEISTYFDVVFFKFHPNEYDSDIEIIKSHLAHIKNIKYLEKHITQEEFKSLPISFGASFLSTALREYSFYGMIPLYFFHLFPSVISEVIRNEMSNYLNSIGYRFIENLSDLSVIQAYNSVDDIFIKQSPDV